MAGSARSRRRRLVTALLLSALGPGAAAGGPALPSLERTLVLALTGDPWLRGSELRQAALAEEAVAAGALPDPVLSLEAANLPVDGFAIDQEPMTQFRVGLSQMFPPGDSRALRRQQLDLRRSREPLQRRERRARIEMRAAQLWLDAFRADAAVRLLEQDRSLFENLVDLAEAAYGSGLGRSRQQDLLRAQLELTRFEDRLLQLRQRREIARGQLFEWLGGAASAPTAAGSGNALPEISLRRPEFFREDAEGALPSALDLLLAHPALAGIDRQIAAGRLDIDLARQKYRPQWSLHAAYGYRDDDPAGMDRADFFSLGASLSLPLFTGGRQDRQLAAAQAGAAALESEKALLLRQLAAEFEAARARLLHLDRRRALYRTRLLVEMGQQAESAHNAYTSADGDFDELMRARIAEINARIDALDIDVERLQTIAQLNYLLAGDARDSAGMPAGRRVSP